MSSSLSGNMAKLTIACDGRTVDLTPAEVGVLHHRLTVPDCICEVLAPEEETQLQNAIMATIDRFEAAFADGRLSVETTIDRDVLAELVEGNTIGGCIASEESGEDKRMPSSWRAFRSACRKVQDVLGRKLDMPAEY